MVLALAGRRVDALGAKPIRFPQQNIHLVEERIRSLLRSQHVDALVCSAACGADLLALAVAGELAIRRRVILPYARDLFRDTSVVDRPGDWGERYDRVLDAVNARGDLIVLEGPKDDTSYAIVNSAILDNALAMAREFQQAANAAVVWDGVARGADDLTAEFLAGARTRGLEVAEVSTI
jgi:hypothetical protein